MGRKLSAWLLLLSLLAVSIDAQVPEHGEEAQESEKNEEGVGLAVQAMLPLSCTLILAFVISSSMEACNITWIPESAVVILLGLGLGCIFVFVLGEYNFGEGNIIPVLGPPVVKYALLPIIIFESGWTLRWRDFASQLVYIIIFAVLGSVISMLVVGILIHATSEYHSITRIRTAIAYGSLIAATDPVATLSTYASLKVEPVLNVMVFGESMINDAVAIVVFEIMNSDEVFGNPYDREGTSVNLPAAIAAGIVQKLFCSIAVGCCAAALLTFFLRFASLKHSQLMEILYILVSAYFIYGLAETLHSSGIIATLFGSMIMGIYSKPHLSAQGVLLSTFFVKGTATLADTFTFLIVGVGAVAVSKEPRAFYFSLWVMLFCLVGRALCIIVCGLMVNGIKTAIGHSQHTPSSQWFRLSCRHLFMMWHAGLRGAIALVLCWELGAWVDVIEGEGTKETLVTATLVVIVAFLLVLGGSTQCLLHALGIRMGEDVPDDYLTQTMLPCTQRCGACFHDRCLWPCLVGKATQKDATDDELTRNALHDMLQESGEHHRSHAVFRRGTSMKLQAARTCIEFDSEESSSTD